MDLGATKDISQQIIIEEKFHVFTVSEWVKESLLRVMTGYELTPLPNKIKS